MKVCVYVCVSGACRRTHTSHHPEIWHGLLISPRLGWGATPNVDPRPRPQPHPWPRPLLLLSSLDRSARDYFTIVLWNSPGQRRVAHACTISLNFFLLTNVPSTFENIFEGTIFKGKLQITSNSKNWLFSLLKYLSKDRTTNNFEGTLVEWTTYPTTDRLFLESTLL